MLAHGDREATQLQTALKVQRDSVVEELEPGCKSCISPASCKRSRHTVGVAAVVNAKISRSPVFCLAAVSINASSAPDAPTPLGGNPLLHMAVYDGVDPLALSAIERVTEFRTVLCHVSDHAMLSLPENSRANAYPVQQFDDCNGCSGTGSYHVQLYRKRAGRASSNCPLRPIFVDTSYRGEESHRLTVQSRSSLRGKDYKRSVSTVAYDTNYSCSMTEQEWEAGDLTALRFDSREFLAIERIAREFLG